MNISQGPKARLRRLPQRKVEELEQIHSILACALLCHVAFVQDDWPYCIPTIFARAEDGIYIHGNIASRMLKVIGEGGAACITVSHIDGLVLARSAFHYSAATLNPITDPDLKVGVALPDHVSRVVHKSKS